jgi:hypothetical protein
MQGVGSFLHQDDVRDFLNSTVLPPTAAMAFYTLDFFPRLLHNLHKSHEHDEFFSAFRRASIQPSVLSSRRYHRLYSQLSLLGPVEHTPWLLSTLVDNLIVSPSDLTDDQITYIFRRHLAVRRHRDTCRL